MKAIAFWRSKEATLTSKPKTKILNVQLFFFVNTATIASGHFDVGLDFH
jgi:hypothetical protein